MPLGQLDLLHGLTESLLRAPAFVPLNDMEDAEFHSYLGDSD